MKTAPSGSAIYKPRQWRTAFSTLASTAPGTLPAGRPTKYPQTVGFGGAELRVDAAEFSLHFRVGGHRGEVGFPCVVAAGQAHADVMHEAFQQAQLSFWRQSRKLAFDFVEDWRRHCLAMILSLSSV
jgi:hypothetical protein